MRREAETKIKAAVEISKSIQKEFEREPKGDLRQYDPTPEERAKHELTHLPKEPWCESCTATRSREDNFSVSEKKYDGSLVSMDFKFTGTRDEENAKDVKDALCVSLVMVDQETKFVHAIPVPRKEVTPYLVSEVCRVLMLMEPKVILRTGTEPAMRSLRRQVEIIRKRNGLNTEIQDAQPDEHQGLQVERWVQTVRNLSKTLVYGIEKEAKFKITSESTLCPWVARHAAFLLNRFVVHKGKTPFELVFDREYKGTLAPWGSAVLARELPKVKEKGEPWRKGIFVGKDMVSNANLVATIRGIIKARTMRKCEPMFDVEALMVASGTPWNHSQESMVGEKDMKRIPPRKGIEPIQGGALPAPRSPMEQAASDPPSSLGYSPTDAEPEEGRNEGSQQAEIEMEENEDPGEGEHPRSSRGGSSMSEELVPGEGGSPSPKRGGGVEIEVEQRPEKMRRAQAVKEIRKAEPEDDGKFSVRRVMSLKSVQEISKFLRGPSKVSQ